MFILGSKVTIKQDFIMPINGKDTNLKGLECFICSVSHFKPKRYRQRNQESFTYELELPDGNILTCGEDALLKLVSEKDTSN